MLTANYLNSLPDTILSLYQNYEDSVITDIARRLGNMDFDSAAWQMQRLTESGKVYENALQELEKLTGKSEAELTKIFKDAGVKALKFDDAIYKAAGLEPLPLNLSPAMTDVLRAGIQKTSGIMRNLTQTTALTGQEAFISAADLAYMQVSSGAFDYNSAIEQVVKQVASNGLSTIEYASGRVDQLDVAVRRTVLTGINQTVGNMQIARADEMGADLVETSAHAGARTSHAIWQGRVFSRSGTSHEYPNFVKSTGYGTGAGLMGWNCRHSFYPFFEGLSESAYTQEELADYRNQTVQYNGKEISVYDATQEQRRIERKIRYWKRQENSLEAAGLPHEAATAKVKQWQGTMRDFIGQMNENYKGKGIGGTDVKWQRQTERERVISKPKTVGFSFLSGDTRLTSTSDARALGESAEGWNKHEKIFRENYLKPYKLIDDVEKTIGFWGGPEPSFNAHVEGLRKNVIEMSKAWAKDFNQQGMALLIPNPKGAGGKLKWDFGKTLSDSEMDSFFKNLDDLNKEFGEKFNDYFGVTTKGSKSIEYWYSGEQQEKNARYVIGMALRKTNLLAEFGKEHGYDFILLSQGVDY